VHCRKAYLFEEKLLAKYGGKVNLVYRHNPLPEVQPLSGEKALIAECVYDQGRDETMFHFITDVYENFDIINKDNDWVMSIAKKYVDDKTKLESCINDPKEKEKITIAKNKAIASAVIKTPTIVIFEGTKLIERNDGMGEANVAKSLEYWLTR
jgi:protein-disulfide isomerase